ncbi:MAG: DNA-binding protein [Bacillota bacterium]|nr:DNA-binding protein [Bacillota bacterium]
MSDKQDAPRLVCDKCGLPLQMVKVAFSYLGRTFHSEVPACPGCGQVFVSRELAKGRMANVETVMEDK